MKQCNECGTTNPDAAKFCEQCGSPLAPNRNTGTIIAIVLCALAVVGAIIWGFIYLADSKNEKANVGAILHTGTIDSSIVAESQVVAPGIIVAPATEVKEQPKAEPASVDNVKGSGTIDGNPFTLTGKWKGKKLSGRFVCKRYDLNTKFTGEYWDDGSLAIELDSDCGEMFVFDKNNGKGRYSGEFSAAHAGSFPATLVLESVK